MACGPLTVFGHFPWTPPQICQKREFQFQCETSAKYNYILFLTWSQRSKLYVSSRNTMILLRQYNDETQTHSFTQTDTHTHTLSQSLTHSREFQFQCETCSLQFATSFNMFALVSEHASLISLLISSRFLFFGFRLNITENPASHKCVSGNGRNICAALLQRPR